MHREVIQLTVGEELLRIWLVILGTPNCGLAHRLDAPQLHRGRRWLQSFGPSLYSFSAPGGSMPDEVASATPSRVTIYGRTGSPPAYSVLREGPTLQVKIRCGRFIQPSGVLRRRTAPFLAPVPL